MSLITDPGNGHVETPPVREEAPVGPVDDAALWALTDEVRRQNGYLRRGVAAFSIFALVALVIAGVNLLAVAVKLDKTTAATPAAVVPAAKATAPVAPAPVHAVDVGLREFAIAPSPAVASAGKVTFTVHNTGLIKHELVVLRTSKAAGDLTQGSKAVETGNVGEIPNLPAGATKTLSLRLKPGHYAFICNLPGHYLAGQHADFTVR
jgi:uncharacterized cupredoxin-like copper-binding protein